MAEPVRRKLDTSRTYGLLCPPGPGGVYFQDYIHFDADGYEILAPGAQLESLAKEPVTEAGVDFDVAIPVSAMKRDAVIRELAELGVKVDLRKSDATLREELATARLGKKG